MTTITNCGQCGGHGTTVWKSESIQCPGCGGSGRLRVTEPLTRCGQCGGHGTTVWKGESIQCPGCAGCGYFRG
jgi:DNA-directed RNA polymerase subunit RPC12/RpoP